MKKRNLLIAILISIILIPFISYYIFRISSNIQNKTARANNLDVVYSKIGIIKEVDSNGAKAVISRNRKDIFIEVPNLLKEGAYASFPITVKNVGGLPAKLSSITEYELNERGPIDIIYDGVGVTDKTILPGEKVDFTVKVIWNKKMYGNSASTKIHIRLNYVQG